MTKKKGKRNRLNRNTVKLANDNVKGERKIKGWINRYADQRRGGGQTHIRIGGKQTFADRRYKRDTQIGRQKKWIRGLAHKTDIQIGKNWQQQETDKQIGGK